MICSSHLKNSSSAKIERKLKAADPSYCPILKICVILATEICGLES